MNLNGKVKIGRLDRKIEFQGYSTMADDYGDEVKTWVTEITTFAAVKYDGAGTQEGISNDRETAFNTVSFTIRQRAEFRPSEKMKIIFDSFDYDIISIKEVAETRNRFWLIAAKKTDANDANN